MKQKPRIHYRLQARFVGDTRTLCGTTSHAIRRGAVIYFTRLTSEVTCKRCRAKIGTLQAAPGRIATPLHIG